MGEGTLNDTPHFAYVMYWGAVEPVGLATAVPTVLRLAREARVTLLSFEKPSDLTDEERIDKVAADLQEAGVRWVRLQYTRGFRGTPLDVVRGVLALWKAHKNDAFDAIEGRTFVGGLVAAVLSRLLGIPFLYHTEGCWLEEQVDIGRLGRGSPVLRLLRAVEAWTVAQAGALVSLTEPGARLLRESYLRDRPEAEILIVPTTSVLVESAGEVGPADPIPPQAAVKAIYVGSVTGRYLLDDMLAFFKELVRRRPRSTLEILAHRDLDTVEEAVRRHQLEGDVSIAAVPHYQLPERLRGKDLGFLFWMKGTSEKCCSPTKIPEYLAYGVPVVSTRASGDGAMVLEKGKAGVILDDPGDRRDRDRAFSELDALLQDPERASRAQATARDFYSLEKAAKAQARVLHRMARERGA